MALRLPKQSHILITPDHRLFIDGHEVFGVSSIDQHVDAGHIAELQIVIHPGSVVFGDPPMDTIQHLHEQGLSDPSDTVDINKAIARAKERKKEHP
jgi:flavin-binding protein dodecin